MTLTKVVLTAAGVGAAVILLRAAVKQTAQGTTFRSGVPVQQLLYQYAILYMCVYVDMHI